MNDWMCARSAAMRSAARFCCSARSVRMRTNSSKPPGVSAILPRSRKAMACTARSSRPRSCETTRAAPGKRASQRFQPERRFQVEVVGRLVEQQQIGVGEQRGGEGDAHAPAAGEFFDRPLLRGLVEAEAGEDGGGARRARVGADGDQAFVDFGEAGGVGGLGLGQQGEAFGVALQHGVEQGGGAGRGFLRDRGEAGARGEADFAAVERQGRRRWRAAGWICRRRCGRPGRCGGRDRRSGRRRRAGCGRRGGWWRRRSAGGTWRGG